MAAIGRVTINVKDLDRLTTFYRDVIGLRVLEDAGNTVTLGVGMTPLLVLQERPDFRRYPRTTGLYHFALRVPTRPALAAVLQHFIQNDVRMQGASDHFVSEALYLPDPEGNGIEVYWDRPRAAWYDRDGRFQLGTVALDVSALLTEVGEGEGFAGLPDGTDMGHIHLHVNDIRQAEQFYTGRLGMDVMMNMGSATFLSYDGYHHHVGANIWGGRTPPPEDALGLDRWELRLESDRLTTVVSNLGGEAETTDSAQNRIVLCVTEDQSA
jgi:catechol 2,3-dioxygenase